MTEKKRPAAESTDTRATSQQANGSVRGAHIKPSEARIEGSHTQETVDPAERLTEDPNHQNDVA